MAVVEEWASSTSGPYYKTLYLDGQLVAQSSATSLPVLFGSLGAFPYSYFGTADVGGGYPGTPYTGTSNIGWFFFNGYIALVALYPFVLNSTQVASIGSGSNFKGLPPGYVALYVGNSYVADGQIWFDVSGHVKSSTMRSGRNGIGVCVAVVVCVKRVDLH